MALWRRPAAAASLNERAVTDETSDWRPTATLDALRARADTLALLRRFFADREVLEVETPVLSAAAVTDLHLHSVACRLDLDDRRTRYLQTSPEYAMKRLLAAGSGPIYQICKVFRDGERGRRHNPEFTMLEWYRPGWDHHRLMDEVDELLQAILGVQPGERVSYGDAFRRHAGVDPHAASDGELRVPGRGSRRGRPVAELDRDDLLNLLLSHVVEPHLGCRPARASSSTTRLRRPPSPASARATRPWPSASRSSSTASSSPTASTSSPTPASSGGASRPTSPSAAAAACPRSPVDERLLAALASGLPDCAGVALGVDRLVMLKIGSRDIADVIAFPIERA